jgi:DNA-directed RNA polymerase specialized sigma subunit
MASIPNLPVEDVLPTAATFRGEAQVPSDRVGTASAGDNETPAKSRAIAPAAKWSHALEEVAGESLSEILERARSQVNRLVRNWPGASGDDTLQDAMIVLSKYDTLKGFDLTKGSFWGFAHTVIHRASLRSIEKQLGLTAKRRHRSPQKES